MDWNAFLPGVPAWHRLEPAILRQVAVEWTDFNRELFGSALRPPVFMLHDGKSRLGYWDGLGRVISLSGEMVEAEPWGVSMVVLKHEMVHQFIHEALGRRDETDHGPLFRKLCAERGIESGEEAGLEASGSAGGKVLETVHKLLRLGASPNAHEAEAALRKAEALIRQHNLEHPGAAPDRRFAFRHLGRPTGRVTLERRIMSSILQDFFFVRCIWVYTFDPRTGKEGGRVLEVVGEPENVEIAAYAHDYLVRVGEDLWQDYRRRAPGAHRTTFLYGLLHGFHGKLAAASPRPAGSAIVPRADPQLEAYYDRRHPHTRSMGHSRQGLEEGSLKAGQALGRELSIRPGVGGKAGGPAALPSGRGH